MARVRQVGPDLPSGVRRPDRSVSLSRADAIADAMVPKPEQGVAEFFKTLAEVSGYTDNVVLGDNLVEVSPSVPADHWGYTSGAKHYGTQWAREKVKIAADLGYDVEGRGDWDSLSADERRHVWDEYMDWKKSSVGYKIHAAWRDIQDYARQALFDLEDAAAVEKVNNDIDQQYHRATHSQTSKSVGLSDEDRRLVEQPGGFTPSPPMSGVMPGASLQPPRSPDVGGFQASPPMSGLLPGAPIRGPQGPTVLSMEGQQALPGMEPPPPWALTPKQIATGKEWLPKVRDTLEGTRPPVDSPQSQMSQTMLADMFAQQAQQMDFQNREQAAWKSAGLGSASDPSSNMLGGIGGFLGNVLSARQNAPTALPYAQAGQLSMNAANNLSTEQKIALALLAGAVTGGMSTPMMVPALGIGAGLAAG